MLFAGPIWAATCAIQWAVVFGIYDDIKKVRLGKHETDRDVFPGKAQVFLFF